MNISLSESPTPDSSPAVLITSRTTNPPETNQVPISLPTYTKSNPLSLNDSYRYISGGNEIVVWFRKFELVDTYGMWIDECKQWRHPPGVRTGCWDPTIPVEAPKGKKFLFVFFSFLNTGNTSASIPEPEKFTLLIDQGIILSPASSIQDNDTTRIEWIGKESEFPMEDESALVFLTSRNIYDSPPELYPSPLSERNIPAKKWYIPFIVPRTFDPAKSYISVRFNENASAVWKFR